MTLLATGRPPVAVRAASGLWLADGNSLTATLDSADLTWWGIALSRLLHVAAVWAAVPLMFTGSANAYFRRTA